MARPRLGAATLPTTAAFGDTPSAGTPGDNAALATHRHGMMAAPPGGDVTAPAKPTIKTTRSDPVLDVDQQEDGTAVVRITGTVGFASAPGITDLDAYAIQFTREVLSDNVTPDWSLASERLVASIDATGAGNTPFTITPVLPGAVYTLRANALDKSGNRSVVSDPVVLVASADVVAPSRPTNIVTQGGHTTIGVQWAPVTAVDFAYSEVGWRKTTDASFSQSVQTGGNLVVLTGLVNGTAYDVRVRSVDASGNTLHDTGTVDGSGNPIYVSVKASDPTVGWVDAPDATPIAISADALAWSSAIIGGILAGQINADWIVAGTLRLGATGQATAIEVYSTGTPPKLVGRWSTTGLQVLDATNPNYQLLISPAGLVISNAGVPVVSLTPIGIDAASVTFGSARGGHNLVANSSFEMGGFGAQVQTDSAWDLAADFNASRIGSDTNITTGTGDLHMTGTT